MVLKRKFEFNKRNNEELGSQSSFVKLIDYDTESTSIIKGQNRKLRKQLTDEAKEEPKNFNSVSKYCGLRESDEEAICEVLNEVLVSNTLLNLIRGVKYPASLIEIKDVRAIGDCSKYVVVWGSDLFDKFIMMTREKKGEEEGRKVAIKFSSYISNTLQKKEPFFRSRLMRKMTFRRVPNLTFKMESNSENDIRQYFVEQATKNA